MKKVGILFNILFSLVVYMLGGFDSLIKSLLVIMVIDYITGVIKAIYYKNFSKKINIKGILKKFGYLIIVALATVIDTCFSIDSMALRTVVLYFFIVNESMSIIENWASLGLPLPNKLYEVLNKLKENNN